MKKASFRDHCIPVNIHLYNQPNNTFSEQMLLSDLDRQKYDGKAQPAIQTPAPRKTGRESVKTIQQKKITLLIEIN